MKANEAPEKIYVSNYSSGLTYNWHPERLAVNDIEYTRTDAFIEKACSWFREVKEQECSFDGIDAFIIHFKEAMKL